MSDGKGCRCAAKSAYECGCDDADWTPKEVIELRQKLSELQAENERLKKLEEADAETIKDYYAPILAKKERLFRIELTAKDHKIAELYRQIEVLREMIDNLNHNQVITFEGGNYHIVSPEDIEDILALLSPAPSEKCKYDKRMENWPQWKKDIHLCGSRMSDGSCKCEKPKPENPEVKK